MKVELYKKDSKGKIRVTIFNTDKQYLHMHSGLLNGKLKETILECTPKNVGRSNETTAEQQAKIELQSRVKKKIDEGYFHNLKEAEESIVVLPMLAKTCKLLNLQYPVIISPKLDGMRAMFNKGQFKSRKNKLIDTVGHIKLEQLEHWYLDGELYSHGDNFQTQMKLIKKYRKGETERIKFHIYDVYIPDSKLSYVERHSLLLEVSGSNFEVVPYEIVNNEQELKDAHSKYIRQGYEGSMIRINDIPYELNKRSNSLLKYKDFYDITALVIDVVPNKQSPTQGTVVCELNGNTFKCGMKMSHEDREELLQNKDKYIGLTAEVRFFEYSDTGVPRFPICHGFRLDK